MTFEVHSVVVAGLIYPTFSRDELDHHVPSSVGTVPTQFHILTNFKQYFSHTTPVLG